MPVELNVRRAAAGVGFMLGLDTAYNIGSFSLSAPQTTERRIKDTEGKSETPKEAMRWVWISSVKMLVYTGFSSLLMGSWWPLIGGLVVTGDLHASYRYAIYCGKKSVSLGGAMLSRSGFAARNALWDSQDASEAPATASARVRVTETS